MIRDVETWLDLGAIGTRKVEVSYRCVGQKIEVSEVLLHIDRPISIYNYLTDEAQDFVYDVAKKDYAEYLEGEACDHADAQREEMLMAADPRSHGPDFE